MSKQIIGYCPTGRKETKHTDEEAFQQAIENEIICNDKYCPWWQEHRFSPSCPICEGNWCEEAWQAYQDEIEKK